MDVLPGRKAKAVAAVAKLIQDVAPLQKEAAEMDAGEAEAMEQRNAEHIEYEGNIKDYAEEVIVESEKERVAAEYYP